MLTKDQIIACLSALNDVLVQKDIRGEIGLYGGTVMCLALNARQSTHDVDAIFNPKTDVSQAAKQVAQALNLDEDWLNDAVKGFVSAKNDLIYFDQFSNLTVYVASAPYMFAMKALSSRIGEGNDVSDLKFLIRYIGIQNVEQAMVLVYQYYPQQRVPQKAFYLLEEIFDGTI